MHLTKTSIFAALLGAIVASAAPVDLESRQSKAPVVIDDSSKSVTYTGSWTHLTNQGSAYADGSLSYTGAANA